VLWFGAFTSASGTWMQRVAQAWLITELTKSPFFLGLDAFLGELPILLFTLIGGVVADRRDRRQLLLGSQYIQMTAAFVLAGLAYTGVVQIWHILALSFASGLAQAFGGPAYQSLIPSLVDRKDLPNAIALNSTQFNLAQAVGPALAGLTFAAIGLTACFALNGVSFLVVIVALLSLNVKHIAPTDTKPLLNELRSGLSYVRHEGALLSLTVLAFSTAFLGFAIQTQLPIVVQNVFQSGVAQYSRMLTCVGIGAVAGALGVAWVGNFRHMGLTALLMDAALGLLLVLFALSRSMWLDYVLLFFCGGAVVVLLSLMMSLVQLTVPNQMRGRVVSIYMVAFRGGRPIGSLVTGYVAQLTSAPIAIGVSGMVLMVVAGYFLIKSHGVREL
jgi:predicted MFS family arabinose efflux permease